jgi:hypothetical protein
LRKLALVVAFAAVVILAGAGVTYYVTHNRGPCVEPA